MLVEPFEGGFDGVCDGGVRGSDEGGSGGHEGGLQKDIRISTESEAKESGFSDACERGPIGLLELSDEAEGDFWRDWEKWGICGL